MNLVAALARLAAFSKSVGALYERLAEVLPDGEVSTVFGRLALQEQTHVILLEHLRRVALHGGVASPVAELDIAELDLLTETAEELRSRERHPEVAEAVTAAMLIELSAAERIHGAMVNHVDPSLSALFTRLARDDDRNVRLLMGLAERIERAAA